MQHIQAETITISVHYCLDYESYKSIHYFGEKGRVEE